MSRAKENIMENFLDLAADLSPENLYCDGEASNEEVEESLKSIHACWKKLEEEIGYKVTESDAWNWYREEKEKNKPIQHQSTSNQPVLPKKITTFSLKR